ncbi:MAG: hypothetical protein R2827_05745 [Bdellovibrionales bacterium]
MEIESHRMISGDKQSSDSTYENALRPKSFEQFPGQAIVKEKLKVFVEAAKKEKNH